jgi:hypothetical protein
VAQKLREKIDVAHLFNAGDREESELKGAVRMTPASVKSEHKTKSRKRKS